MKKEIVDLFNGAYAEIAQPQRKGRPGKDSNLGQIMHLLGLNKNEAMALVIYFYQDSNVTTFLCLEDLVEAIHVHLPKTIHVPGILQELANRGILRSSFGLLNRRDFGLSSWLLRGIYRNDEETFNRKLPRGMVNAAQRTIEAIHSERDLINMDRIQKSNPKLSAFFTEIEQNTQSNLEKELLFTVICFEISRQPFTIGMIKSLNGPIVWVELVKEQLVKGVHYFITQGYFSTGNNQFKMIGEEDSIPLRLTEAGKEKFLFPFITTEEKRVFLKSSMEINTRNDAFGIVKNLEIPHNNLIYNGVLKDEISLIKNIVSPENFKLYQEQFTQNSRKKGLAMIFSGPPGTGKTSLAYQLAKESGRDIIPLDISKLLSKWVGDTEKNFSKLFEYYQTLVKEKDTFPILLIDEGDSFMHQRLSNTESSVDIMNNHLTSTLLKALDTFSGIMIITTNFMASFDKAFLRRFLFKMELPLPDIEAKKKLIHHYLPDLVAHEPIINELLENNVSGADLENLKTLKTLYSTFSADEEDHLNYIRNYLKGSPKAPKIGFSH